MDWSCRPSGRTDGQRDGRTGARMDRWTYGWTDEQRTDGRTNGRTDGRRTDRRTNGRMNGRPADGQADGQADGGRRSADGRKDRGTNGRTPLMAETDDDYALERHLQHFDVQVYCTEAEARRAAASTSSSRIQQLLGVSSDSSRSSSDNSRSSSDSSKSNGDGSRSNIDGSSYTAAAARAAVEAAAAAAAGQKLLQANRNIDKQIEMIPGGRDEELRPPMDEMRNSVHRWTR